jgi:hypothetical protein
LRNLSLLFRYEQSPLYTTTVTNAQKLEVVHALLMGAALPVDSDSQRQANYRLTGRLWLPADHVHQLTSMLHRYDYEVHYCIREVARYLAAAAAPSLEPELPNEM